MKKTLLCGVLASFGLLSGCAEDVSNTGEASDPLSSPESMTRADSVAPPVAVNNEPGRDVSALHLGAPGTTRPLPERGGSGGSPVPTLRGAVIYGIQTNTGRLVDHVELAYYIPSGSDNIYRAGDFFGTLGPYGGGGGTWHDWQYCPPGYGAIGIQGRAADKLDALGLICADLKNPARQTTLQVYGGGGGNAFQDTCNTNELLTGINLRTGRVVDRIQGFCQSAH